MKKALIVINVQKDFFKHGNMIIQDSHMIIPVINYLMANEEYETIVAVKDLHPKNHISFASTHSKNVFTKTENGILWPDHCIVNTTGSHFHNGLNISKINKTFYKGTNINFDSSSAFYNSQYEQTGLFQYLKQKNISHTHVVGLTLENDITKTAFDCIKFGFKSGIVFNACKPLDVSQGFNITKNIKEFGIEIIISTNILQ